MVVSDLIKIQRLEKDQNLDKHLFRFSKGSTIRFCYGPSLFGSKINCYFNYPINGGEFKRDKFYLLKWIAKNSEYEKDEFNLFVDIKLLISGSFRYYYTLAYDSDGVDKIQEKDYKQKILGSGYCLVDPQLSVCKNVFIDLDSIQCQTVISKNLGTLDSWKDKLKVSYKTSYNMLHFTPIQELGSSNSAYSLKNQLKLNSHFCTKNKNYSLGDVTKLIRMMQKEWGILSITDIVLNHTANESPWIKEHPECCYNLTNTPHLRPAYLLDRVFYHLTRDIISGQWKSKGITVEINTPNHLDILTKIIKSFYLIKVNIHEMFQVNVAQLTEEFQKQLRIMLKSNQVSEKLEKLPKLKIIQDPKYRRFHSQIDMNLAISKYSQGWDHTVSNLEEWIQTQCIQFQIELEKLNQEVMNKITDHLNAGVANVMKGVTYERLSPDGPKIKLVSEKHPIITQYFYQSQKIETFEDEEIFVFDENLNKYIFAHNGWVMGDDPLRNFASSDSNVYLRRELIAWGDSVKLRYGNSPQDCPFLWKLMQSYVEETARIFHGIRLDNCHSTPIPVAEYLLDCARKIRPDLYVIAELFTSSEQIDNIFVNRLGITSLIRESLAAQNSHELGRFIHRYGGNPVGAFSKSKEMPLIQNMAHAIIFDFTHDNESPLKKRSAFDFLPTAGLLSMSCSAIGSNRGYDELVPHHINVVNENRTYRSWDETAVGCQSDKVSYNSGIVYAKKLFNQLHSRLANEGYSEIFVDQVNYDVVAITRHNPSSHKSIVLIARTCFNHPINPRETGFISSLTLAGSIEKIILEGQMVGDPNEYEKSDTFINGLKSFKSEIRQNLAVDESSMVKVYSNFDENKIEFTHFPPSSVIIFEISLEAKHLDALHRLKDIFSKPNDLINIIAKFNFDDFNYLLFRTGQEEEEDFGGGVYHVPNFTSFNFCGLGGLMYYWKQIRTTNDLGHPICNNLREGLWLPTYIVNRLDRKCSTKALSKWLKTAFSKLSDIPVFLRPRYFDEIITPLYFISLDFCWKNFSPFIQNGSNLVKLLALGSIALIGHNTSSPLPPLSNKIRSAKFESTLDDIENIQCPTIAAGLPHFATGYMRNWGRDTFISLRGLLLLTGRFDEAKYIILGFAGALRHGLIPNLLDRGINSRYNCRDAVWWWIECIKNYTEIVPNGLNILQEPVRRMYPDDNSLPLLHNAPEQPLLDVIQECIVRHFIGINFRERNAGTQIDAHMTHHGFNIHIGINRETGFVFGGNEFNCGTWMDKMGSSDKAKNRGKPSTPRDASAVEMVGLLKSVISWIDKLHSQSLWPYKGVDDGKVQWTWKQWADKIQENFEKKFWVSLEDQNKLINRREIYKDSFGATHAWQDYQFRPNFLIAMAVAPELFNPEHARKALKLTQKILIGPLGVKTLDPSDWNHRGEYINSDDSHDYHTAHGFNYHQGPEWVWPLGYYFQALLKFSEDKKSTITYIKKSLSIHHRHLETSPWYGLPELTNSDGKYCSDSCHIQAWSHSTLLETLYMIENL